MRDGQLHERLSLLPNLGRRQEEPPGSIEDEQTFIDRAHSLLDENHIDHLRSRISFTTNAPSTGTGQDELEREALLDNLRLQLHAAEAARPRMCFGRLRFDRGDDHPHRANPACAR